MPEGVRRARRRPLSSIPVVNWSRVLTSEAGGGVAGDAVPVFFLSDSTGISAETMGNALLIQFPDLHFERTLIPFISTVAEAREVVAQLDAAMDGPITPLCFSTAAVDEVREELLRTKAPIRSEEHTSELQSLTNLVCRLLLEKKK